MMGIDFINLDAVQAYAGNSNTHPEEQLEQIENLMIQFGWTVPALVHEQGGGQYRMLAGHGRMAVAQRIYVRGESLVMSDGEVIPAGCIPVEQAA